MSGFAITLLATALFSFLPLGVLLYKRRRVNAMISTGTKAQAVVYHVTHTRKSALDFVSYRFYDVTRARQFTGSLTTKMGAYKNGDVLDVYYFPGNPARSTVPGAWKSNFLLVFAAALGLFVCWGMYQLWLEGK